MRIRELTEEECFALLPRVRCARPACGREGAALYRPHVVGLRGHFFLRLDVGGSKGRMDACQPTSLRGMGRGARPLAWTTVIALGTYEELPTPPRRKGAATRP